MILYRRAIRWISTSISGCALFSLHVFADYRLGEFDAITLGVRVDWTTESGKPWNARLEYNSADGSVPSNLLIGKQTDREIYPDLDAVIFQLGYKFGK